MRKSLLSLTTIAVLSLAGEMNTASNTKILATGLDITATQQYDYLYRYHNKNYKDGYYAYKHFIDLSNVLNNPNSRNILAQTVFNPDVNNNLQYSHKLYQLLTTITELRQAKGLPVQINYTVQKIVNHTAVTITLNLEQIVTRYVNFLKYLKEQSNTKEQFNSYFKTLGTYLYWVKNDDLDNKLFGVIGGKTVVATATFASEDVLSPSHFIYLLMGENYARKDELAHNKELAKLVNYILIEDYSKAFKLIKNPSENIKNTKNYLYRIFTAMAKMEAPNQIQTKDKLVVFLINKAQTLLNKLPANVKVENPTAKQIVYAYFTTKENAAQIAKNYPNLDLRAPITKVGTSRISNEKLHTNPNTMYYATNVCFSVAKRKNKNNNVLGHYKACLLSIAEQIKNKVTTISAYKYNQINKIYKKNPEVKKGNKEFQKDFCGKFAGAEVKKTCNFWLDYYFKEAKRRGIK